MRLSEEQALVFAQQAGVPTDALGLTGTNRSNPRSGRTTKTRGRRNPQAELTLLARQRWGREVRADYGGAIPGRKFEIDIALPRWQVAIEVDGWAYHGKHKSDFHRDREKRNLLVVAGWQVLAFSARDVFADPAGLLDMADALIQRQVAAGQSNHV